MKKVIITGVMRSGTTLISNFLNSQESCEIYRDYAVTLFRLTPKMGIKDFNHTFSMREKSLILSNLKAEILDLQTIRLNDFETLEELLDLSLNKIALRDTKMVGTKITNMSDWIPLVLDQTNILIIYIYRDLRDVLLSSQNRFVDYNMFQFAKDWDKDIMIAQKITHPRFFPIKFEDLILNPQIEIGKMSEFLNIPLNLNIQTLRDRNKPNWNDNSAFHDITKLFDPRVVNRWKTKQNSLEVNFASSKYREMLNELGYEEISVSKKKALKLQISYYFRTIKVLRILKRILRI